MSEVLLHTTVVNKCQAKLLSEKQCKAEAGLAAVAPVSRPGYLAPFQAFIYFQPTSLSVCTCETTRLSSFLSDLFLLLAVVASKLIFLGIYSISNCRLLFIEPCDPQNHTREVFSFAQLYLL